MRATESVSFCMSTIPQDGRANIFQHNPTDRCWHYVKVPCPKDEYNPSLLVKYGKGKFIGGPECFDFYDPGPCDKERNFDKLNEAKVDPAYAKEFKGLRGPTAPEPLGNYNDIFAKKQLEIAKIYRSAIDKYRKFYDEFVGSDQARQTQHYNDWKKVYQDVNWGGVLPNQGRRAVGKRTPGRAPVKSEAQANQVEAQEEESEEEEDLDKLLEGEEQEDKTKNKYI